MTQQSFSQLDVTRGRYPLSFTQQYFHSLDEGDLNGAFGDRFTPGRDEPSFQNTMVLFLNVVPISVIEQDLPDFNAPSGYNRILPQLVSEPDREWRQLAGLAS